MMLVASGVTGALVFATAQGAIGAQSALSGLNFAVTANQLNGTGFEQFATFTVPNLNLSFTSNGC
jgi:hypothetical protein